MASDDYSTIIVIAETTTPSSHRLSLLYVYQLYECVYAIAVQFAIRYYDGRLRRLNDGNEEHTVSNRRNAQDY